MHLLVGLNGAGKSTLARSIERSDGAVLAAGHLPVLHHVATDVEQSVARARDRAAAGDAESHPLDEAELRRFATIVEVPGDAAAEGMRVVVHG